MCRETHWRMAWRVIRTLLFVSPIFIGLLIVNGFASKPPGSSATPTVTDAVPVSSASVPPGWDQRVFVWPKNSFPEDDWRIFFHETSGAGDITMRQSCAVESAAKHNPNRTVQLFLQADARRFNYSSHWMAALSHYPNAQVILLDAEEYFKGTPFEDWHRKGLWKASPYRWVHMADYIRILSLLRGGGMFLDLDVITLKPYVKDIFWNFLSAVSSTFEYIANGMIHFEKAHWFISDVVDLLKQDYDPHSYMLHGPDAVMSVMNVKCGYYPGRAKHRCKDVHLLDHGFFFPVGVPFLGKLFQDAEPETMESINRSYAIHVSNWRTQNSFVDFKRPNQVMSILARRNCPFTVHAEMGAII